MSDFDFDAFRHIETIWIDCPADGISPEDIAAHLSLAATKVFFDICDAIVQCRDNVERNREYKALFDSACEGTSFVDNWRRADRNAVVVKNCPIEIADELCGIGLEYKDNRRCVLATVIQGYYWNELDGEPYAIFDWGRQIGPDGKILIFDEGEDCSSESQGK